MSSGVFGDFIEQLLEQQKEIMRRMVDISIDKRLTREWYVDAECACLKGIPRSTLSMHRWMQPGGGKGKQMIASRLRHHRSTVKEWLEQSDWELLELYATPEEKAVYLSIHPGLAQKPGDVAARRQARRAS